MKPSRITRGPILATLALTTGLFGAHVHAATVEMDIELVNPDGVTTLAVENLRAVSPWLCGVSPTDNVLSQQVCVTFSTRQIRSSLCNATVTRTIVVSPTDNIVISPTDNIVVSPTDNGDTGLEAARTIVVSPTDNIVISPTDNIVVSPTDNNSADLESGRESQVDDWGVPGNEGLEMWQASCGDGWSGDEVEWVVVYSGDLATVVVPGDLSAPALLLDEHSSLVTDLALELLDLGVYPDEIDLDGLGALANDLSGDKEATARVFELLEPVVDAWFSGGCASGDALTDQLCATLD